MSDVEQTGGGRTRRPRTPASRPWDRRANETSESHAAFLAYRDLGPRRSLEQLSRDRTGTIPKISTLKGWSARHEWVNRCIEWDDYLQGRRDEAAADYAAQAESRRLESLDQTWSLADDLARKAKLMMTFPLTTTRVEDGITIIEPAGWSWATIVAMVKTICELRAAVLAAMVRPVGEYSEIELLAIQRARDEYKAAKAGLPSVEAGDDHPPAGGGPLPTRPSSGTIDG